MIENLRKETPETAGKPFERTGRKARDPNPSIRGPGGSAAETNMKKTFLFSLAVPGILFSFIFANTLVFAELPEVNQEDDLSQRYQEGVAVKRNTIEAPLLTSDLGAGMLQTAVMGFQEQDVKVESSKNLKLQPVTNGAFRLQYEKLETPAEVAWRFEAPADLSNRWFRMDYSGLMIPPQVFLSANPMGSLHDENLNLFLENSSNPNSVYFKLPGKSNYQAVQLLKMIIDPSVLKEKSGDFMVLNLQMLPKNENPLMQTPKADK